MYLFTRSLTHSFSFRPAATRRRGFRGTRQGRAWRRKLRSHGARPGLGALVEPQAWVLS